MKTCIAEFKERSDMLDQSFRHPNRNTPILLRSQAMQYPMVGSRTATLLPTAALYAIIAPAMPN